MLDSLRNFLHAPSPVGKLLMVELFGWSLGILVLVIGVGAISGYNYLQEDVIYSGISIDDTKVGGLSTQDALQFLLQNKKGFEEANLTNIITLQNGLDPKVQLASSSAELGLRRDYESAVAFAYAYGRTGTQLQKIRAIISAPLKQPSIATQLTFEAEPVANFVNIFKEKVDIKAKKPNINLKKSGDLKTLVIETGEAGLEIPLSKGIDRILQSNQLQSITVVLTPEPTGLVLDGPDQSIIRSRVEKLLNTQVTLKAEDTTFNLYDTDLIHFLGLPQGYAPATIATQVTIWAGTINRKPQDALFEYDPATLKVTSFQPDKPGLNLNQTQTEKQITLTLQELENETTTTTDSKTAQQSKKKTIELEIDLTPAEQTLAGTNDLGITERIGWGESTYHHSIPNRIHNVEVTAQRINNTLVAPGAEFSFNKNLGEVSAATGYKAAYVISGGRTVLGDGGGVCQVSTTLFRALLDAGLKISRRLPHSYRVDYYEQNSEPGFDATVYAGGVDLRFINDTGHSILIHTIVDSDNTYLKEEIYGTSDGRTAEISNYKKWGATAALPPQYFPDASLPAGKVKQIDWAVGGLKTEFTHTVKDKNGEITSQETYSSNYRPWSAKYLVGQ